MCAGPIQSKAIGSLSLKAASADYILKQARLLGLPTRMARSELHVVKAHQKVLELPGTGGQLAHHLVSGQKDLTLQDNFAVACGSWQELTLAGVVALEGIVLDKSSQTSNWSRRPLAADPLSCAALQAEVLLALHARFEVACSGRK